MPTTYFISGTDTNVGKTIVSAVLATKFEAHYFKPIQCGLNKMNLKDFKEKIEKLSWDDFMTVFGARDLYSEEMKEAIKKEHSRRASQFNKYMSF